MFPIRKLQAFAPIAMPIVFIAIEKADRLGLGMDLRGYGTPGRTYLRKLSLHLADWVIMVVMILIVVGATALALLGYGQVAIPK